MGEPEDGLHLSSADQLVRIDLLAHGSQSRNVDRPTRGNAETILDRRSAQRLQRCLQRLQRASRYLDMARAGASELVDSGEVPRRELRLALRYRGHHVVIRENVDSLDQGLVRVMGE